MTTRRTLATLAAVLVVLVAGVALLYAVRTQGSPTMATSPTASAMTAAATAAATTAAGATACPPANVVVAPSATPEASRTPADPSWQQLRRDLPPGVPIIEPTWMPAVFSGVRAQISAVAVSNAASATYTVSYRADRDVVTFSLGGLTPPAPPLAGTSGVGTTVRRSPAALNFPSDLFAHPNCDGSRVVGWTEGSYALRIESQTISGDDLLHIAWSLDLTGAPGLVPTRVKPGACADAISPEATARRLIALIGTHDRDALTDCFASEAGGYAAGWTDLPSATLDSVSPIQGAGGRSQLQMSWTFATDPGGAWNRRPTNFFLIGREDGVWRVFAVNTAPFQRAP